MVSQLNEPMCTLLMQSVQFLVFKQSMSVWSGKDDLNLWIKLSLLLKEIILYLYWNVIRCELEIWFDFGF